MLLGHVSAGLDINCFSRDTTLSTLFLVFNCGFPAHLTQNLRQCISHKVNLSTGKVCLSPHDICSLSLPVSTSASLTVAKGCKSCYQTKYFLESTGSTCKGTQNQSSELGALTALSTNLSEG